MIGQTISHYKIVQKLGQGGMGVVYIAQDIKLDRKVALKFLPPSYSFDEDAKKRFIQEAKAISSFQHHNICSVHEIDETDEGQLFICMDLYEGETLKEKIEKGSLDLQTIIDIIIQISEGLAKAHNKNIIHRDIKPANIYITNDGIVKILDFGLAKVSSQTQMTMMGATMGTAAYMSPEQSKGGNVDHRTDIWALGVILYEMIAAQQPFKGDYEQVVIYSIINEIPEKLTNINKEIPEKLESIVNKAIEKNQEDRYQNIEELIDDLTELRDGSSKIQIGRFKKFQPLKFTFVTVTILIIFVIGYLSFQTDVFDRASDSFLKKENSIAVMYFENRTDEIDLEKVLIDMLTTNLARYEELNVVSSQRLFDILNSIEEAQNTSRINHNVATKVAQNAQVKTMLMGSIIKIGNNMRITSQLTDVESGEIIASEQIRGNNIEDIFRMADELTQKVANSFTFEKGKSKVDSFKIADVSTNSYDAYKFFVRGLEDSWQFKLGSAAKNFRAAIEFDSTFAMANLYWAMAEGGLQSSDPYSDLSEVNRALQQAEHYSYKTTNKERLYIKAHYISDFLRDRESALKLFEEYVRKYPNDKEGILSLGWVASILMDIEKTEQAFNRLIELDPSFADAYLLMAYTYSSSLIDDKAISMAKKYVELQPDNWNTYATLWEMNTQAGRYKDAYKVCANAMDKFDFNVTFKQCIGILHLLEKEVSKARESFQLLIDFWSDKPNGAPVSFSKLLPYSYIFEGKYLIGFDQLNEIYKIKLQNDNLHSALITTVDLGKLVTITGNYNRADSLFSEALRLSSKLYSESYNTSKIIINYYRGINQLKNGDVIKARKTAEDMKKLIEGKNYKLLYLDYVFLLFSEIYLYENNNKLAISEFDKVSEGTKYIFPRAQKLSIEINTLSGNFDLAISQCVRFYNKVGSSALYNGGDAFDYFYEISKIPYTLGKIYEMKGEPDKAVERYEEAIDLWKNADPGLFYLEDAKSRLAKLKLE